MIYHRTSKGYFVIKFNKIVILLLMIFSHSRANEETITINRMPESDLQDRLAVLKELLSGEKLDSTSLHTLDKLREQAEIVARVNFECNSRSINDIPNPRCKEFYLKDLPAFEEEYSNITGNIYMNRISLSKNLSDRRGQINSCVNAMEGFLNPEFTPQKIASLKIVNATINPVDDSTMDVLWTVSEKLDSNIIKILYHRISAWKNACLDIITNNEAGKRVWNVYYLSQAKKHFAQTPFLPIGEKILYRNAWAHKASLNGVKLIQIDNPTYEYPFIDLNTQKIGWNWGNTYKGKARISEGTISAVAENVLIRIAPSDSTFIDSKNGTQYIWVKIGRQKWMTKNLNAKPGILSGKSWCYGNDSVVCNNYGRLYDFESANDVCPSGWHLPSDYEWNELIEYAKGKIAGKMLKSVSNWSGNGSGNDAFGFNAIPSGIKNGNIDFRDLGNSAYYWGYTKEYGKKRATIVEINAENQFITMRSAEMNGPGTALSVRCVGN